jgi:hypothetical protein
MQLRARLLAARMPPAKRRFAHPFRVVDCDAGYANSTATRRLSIGGSH